MAFCHVTFRGQKPARASYPKALKTLGDHLRKSRLDQGLLQKEVAARLGVSKDTVRNWELNRTKPDLRLIPRILSFLDLERAPGVDSSSAGELLVAHRRALGMSQSEMAKRIRIDPTTLSRWERGVQKQKLTKAAVLLGEILSRLILV